MYYKSNFISNKVGLVPITVILDSVKKMTPVILITFDPASF